MPGWQKVLLIMLAVLVVFIVSAAYLGVRWVESHRGELKVDVMKAKTEANAFGQGKDPAACVDETFARLDRCNGLMCQLEMRIFLTTCVRASNVPEGFCTSIPKGDQLVAGIRWRAAECKRWSRQNDQRCQAVIAGLQDYCERR
jgi:hypothetical protein